MTATRRLLGTRARLSIALPPWRAHRPVRIELIGVNDGPSASRDHVADGRATAVAQPLTKAGVDPATITRAGQEKPAGSGIATHEVVIRFEDRIARIAPQRSPPCANENRASGMTGTVAHLRVASSSTELADR